MASSTATVSEKQISIEILSLNTDRRENVQENVLFSFHIPISVVWSWKSHDYYTGKLIPGSSCLPLFGKLI